MNEYPPQEKDINFKTFELMEEPSIPEGGKKYELDPDEEHQRYRNAITDKQGNEIYVRESSDGSDWQKFHEYDEEGNKTKTISQKPASGAERETHISYERDDNGSIERGKETVGPDAGLEYEKVTSARIDLGDNHFKEEVTNTIVNQGNNPDQPATGTVFKIEKYYNGNEWVGETGTDTNTGKTWENTQTGEPLPDWAQ